jgi:serine/threonine-protein kinase
VFGQARRVVAVVVVLLLGQAALLLEARRARQAGGIYLSTRPARAMIEMPSAASLGGFKVKPLGRAPGPLPLTLEERSTFTFVVSSWGYQSKNVHLLPAQLASGQAQVVLEPVVPLLVPALYLLRDFPFLALALALSLHFLLRRAWPEWKRTRQVGQLLSLEELQPGAELMGYLVEVEIGRGGMSRVYRVKRVGGPAESLAMKVLRPDFSQRPEAKRRFRDEIDLWRRLSHPNIVHLLDWGESDGFFFLVTELVQGVPLDQADRPSIAKLCEWGEQIVSALRYAHHLGIVHRDLKPANLILSSRVQLLDFGIAVRAEPEGRSGSEGTIGFMAPEQYEGKVGPATDYYALGCTLYTLASGRPPFQAEDTLQLLARQARSLYVPLAELRPDCPPALDTLLAALLVADFEQRLCDPLAVLDYLSESKAWRVSSAEP